MPAKIAIRDRIVELRRVKAGDLLPNPANWRTHPPAQRAALRGVLAEIGYASALLARETPEGLVLIDGHLRAGLNPKQTVPVLILDLDEQEADKLLATLDPLSAMARPDQDKLLTLLQTVQFQDKAVMDMLEALANGETQPLREPTADPGAQMDRAAELQVKWGTARGQIWEVGRHRLMCGDAAGEADRVLLLEGAPILRCLVADPPYGVAYDGSGQNPRCSVG